MSGRHGSPLALAALLAAAACAGDGGGGGPAADAGAGRDARRSDAPAGKRLTFVTEVVDESRAGVHAALAARGGALAVAYYRKVEPNPVVTCPSSTGPGSGGGKKPRPASDLYYARAAGGVFGAPVKVDRTVGATYGLSLALDAAGAPAIGYLGGALSAQECASSDAMIATSKDGRTFARRTLAASGPIGDTVGHWMSVAVDASGKVHAAYRDVRFGYYERDGNAKASLRFDSEVVVANNGAGLYASLAFAPGGVAAIAFANAVQTGAAGGIQLALKKGGAWRVRQLAALSTGERLSLAASATGLGLAYFDGAAGALGYMEASGDLTSWARARVDRSLTRNGEFPSLAFDGKGRPAIAYYRCGRYTAGTCEAGRDGLMYAWRDGGVWRTMEVDGGGNQRCGEYASLAFDEDEPVIAYKCVTFDNVSGRWVDTLKVARGVYR